MSNQVLVFGSTSRESGREDISLDSTTTNPGFVNPLLCCEYYKVKWVPLFHPTINRATYRTRLNIRKNILKAPKVST